MNDSENRDEENVVVLDDKSQWDAMDKEIRRSQEQLILELDGPEALAKFRKTNGG